MLARCYAVVMVSQVLARVLLCAAIVAQVLARVVLDTCYGIKKKCLEYCYAVATVFQVGARGC